MSTPTLLENNEAFVQIEVPFDAAVTTHRVYAASGPNEPFTLRQSFAPDVPNTVSRHFWNHRELGFDDRAGLHRYLIKVTDEVGGLESPLISSKPVLVPSNGEKRIPLKLKVAEGGVVLPNLLTGPGALSEFIISCKDFRRFRVSFDVTLGGASFVEFALEVAEKRTGPFRIHQLAIPFGSGRVNLRDALFRLESDGTGSHDMDIDQAAFLRASARSDAGATSELGLTVERVGKR